MSDIRLQRLADVVVNYSTKVQPGDWVGILGACHGTAATSSHRNSYGTGSHKTTVLGQPITLSRCLM